MNLAGGVVPKKIKNMCLRTYLVWVLPFLVPSKKIIKCLPPYFFSCRSVSKIPNVVVSLCVAIPISTFLGI